MQKTPSGFLQEGDQSSAILYSIVIPTYRSGTWLPELVARIDTALSAQHGKFELILVNDSSPDLVTWDAIAGLTLRYPWVRGIDLLYNAGQFNATICGLEYARGTYIITMDDDLQHPPEELPKLIDALTANPDIDCVFGRYETKQHSWLRNLGSRFVQQVLNRLYGKPEDVVTTSFRIMKRSLAATLLEYRIAQPQMGPMIVTLTRRVKNVTVRHASRGRGQSNYRLGRLIGLTLSSITNASIAPLRFVSLVGFASAFISLLLAIYYLVEKLLGGIAVPGFTTLVLATTFFGGMIM
jgi:dolichol-phosphate mannosyltransferase/undecaprenyl-phosphate 4-deoxy-4-formamido-L-arabinose transferase